MPFYSFHCNFAFTLPCFAFFLLILFVYLLFFRIQISYSVHHLLLPSLSSKVVICILLIYVTVIICEHNSVLQSVFCNCIRAHEYFSLPHSLGLTVAHRDVLGKLDCRFVE